MRLRRKVSPDELKTKLLIASKKLEKREAQMKEQQRKARELAKESLKKGDERGFRLASKRYGLITGQLQAISGMVEMAQSMSDVVEMQEGIKEIAEIGSELKKYQEQLGLDSKEFEKALTNIRSAVEKVNVASEMISTQLEAMTAPSAEVTAAQEELRKELLAELSVEGEEIEELEKKIEKAEKE